MAPRLRRLPTRWRITIWIVTSVLLVTFVVGVIAVTQVRSRFTDRIDSDLRSQSADVATALAILDPEQLEQIVEGSPEGFGGTQYTTVVVGPDGAVLSLPPDDPNPPIDTSPAALGALRSRAGQPFDLESADGSTTYRALVTQLDDGGLLVVTRSLADRDDAIRTVVGVLLFAGAVAAVLIGVTVAVVTSLVTRPLDAMIDTAEAIGEGDLTSRVPTTGVDDVTRLATALNHMLDRLESAFAEVQTSEDVLRRFVADASHELRTPLAAVLGHAELIESGMASDPEQVHAAAARIVGEAERMRVLVEELLTLARLDEARPVEPAPVDLGELARLAVGDARTIDPDRPVALAVPDVPAVVPGDAMALRQAIDNLLANTRAHTLPGTPVRVTVTLAGATVEVTVADDGPGMDADVAAHVFDRFYRADVARARAVDSGPGGSGLGLAIVAAIADVHGGTASVVTSPGDGAAFTVRLPTGSADR